MSGSRSLAGQPIAGSWRRFLQVPNAGADDVLRDVCDGEGDILPLKISQSAVEISAVPGSPNAVVPKSYVDAVSTSLNSAFATANASAIAAQDAALRAAAVEELAEGAARQVDLSPGFGLPDWVGPVAGTDVIYGADLRDGGRFVANHIEAERAQGAAIIPDYWGHGWRQVDINRLGQVVAYVDADGIAWRFDVARNAYISGSEADAPLPASAQPITWSAQEWMERITQHGIRAAGVTIPDGTADTPASPFSPAPLYSTDDATFETYVSWQIPSIATIKRRMFRAEYGRNDVEPGGNGEVAPCYVRLSYSDLDGENPLLNWTRIAYWVPGSSGDGIQDPKIVALADGRLLVIVMNSGTSGPRTCYGTILNNPQNDPVANGRTSWDFGPLCFLGYGFAGAARYYGAELRWTCNEMQNQAAPRGGSKFCRLVIEGEVVRSEQLSFIPPPTDEGQWDFQEASFAPTGRSGVIAFQRTQSSAQVTRSLDGGRTWGTPFVWPGSATQTSSRSDVTRSPSGRLIYAFNNSTARARCAVAVSEDDGETWPTIYTFDPRVGLPRMSYLHLAFGETVDGHYNGKIYVAYDRGRGRSTQSIQDPPDSGNWIAELIVAEIDEDALMAGDQAVTLYADNT